MRKQVRLRVQKITAKTPHLNHQKPPQPLGNKEELLLLNLLDWEVLLLDFLLVLLISLL
jgi:hypothetical protein